MLCSAWTMLSVSFASGKVYRDLLPLRTGQPLTRDRFTGETYHCGVEGSEKILHVDSNSGTPDE